MQHIFVSNERKNVLPKKQKCLGCDKFSRPVLVLRQGFAF